MDFNFAIIGSGLTGTAMLCQFVEKLQQDIDLNLIDPSKIKIQIFEKQDAFGPGFPHSDKNVMPFHITNMCAGDMGIRLDHPADFQNWVEDNHNKLNSRFPGLEGTLRNEDECNHYPRAIMGEYLKDNFIKACQKARALGLVVDLKLLCEVIDMEEKNGRIRLTVKRHSTASIFSCIVDRVLLATGHWFEAKGKSNYIPSPWPAKRLLQRIPQGEQIAVIGTSLSAIEVVLTLTSDGSFIRNDSGEKVYVPPAQPRHFGLYSRNGLLPKVRGRTGTYRNKFLTRENVDNLMAQNQGYLPLKSLFQLLNSELEAAYGYKINWKEVINPTGAPADCLRKYIEDAKTGDGPDGEVIWQTILHQSFDMVRKIYLSLTLEDRKRFDKEYTSIFFTHAATQPIINAEKIAALMRAGIVQVFRLGREFQLVENDSRDAYELIYKDHKGCLNRDIYRYVVDARGQAKSIQSDPSTLTKNLLKRGLVKIEETQAVQSKDTKCNRSARPVGNENDTYTTGSIWIDPETHQIMESASKSETIRSKALYAVGAMTRGQIIDASMAYGIVQSTAKIAADLIVYLRHVKI